MQMTVRDEEKQFDRQTHAYAEYRVFSALAGDGSSHRSVTVTLTRMDGTGSRYPVQCTVAVTMSSGDVVKVHALERHPYAAIDRAAALIGKAVRRHRAQGSVTLLTSGASQDHGQRGRT
jgi:ribosome-associated translation inhibitor RaiA